MESKKTESKKEFFNAHEFKKVTKMVDRDPVQALKKFQLYI